jgi:hypothetical protein
MSDNKIPNGGFPPLKYCKENFKKNSKEFKKERFFKSDLKKNINIKDILNIKNNKDIIKYDDNELDVIKEL